MKPLPGSSGQIPVLVAAPPVHCATTHTSHATAAEPPKHQHPPPGPLQLVCILNCKTCQRSDVEPGANPISSIQALRGSPMKADQDLNVPMILSPVSDASSHHHWGQSVRVRRWWAKWKSTWSVGSGRSFVLSILCCCLASDPTTLYVTHMVWPNLPI